MNLRRSTARAGFPVLYFAVVLSTGTAVGQYFDGAVSVLATVTVAVIGVVGAVVVRVVRADQEFNLVAGRRWAQARPGRPVADEKRGAA